MIGAIIGDIVGSRFEWFNHRSKDFELLSPECFFTDDSVMSLAVCDALMRSRCNDNGLSGLCKKSGVCIRRAVMAIRSFGGCIQMILNHTIAMVMVRQ